MTRPAEDLHDYMHSLIERAFFLLGGADAVMNNLLADASDEVARTQARLWLQDLEALLEERVDA